MLVPLVHRSVAMSLHQWRSYDKCGALKTRIQPRPQLWPTSCQLQTAPLHRTRRSWLTTRGKFSRQKKLNLHAENHSSQPFSICYTSYPFCSPCNFFCTHLIPIHKSHKTLSVINTLVCVHIIRGDTQLRIGQGISCKQKYFIDLFNVNQFGTHKSRNCKESIFQSNNFVLCFLDFKLDSKTYQSCWSQCEPGHSC